MRITILLLSTPRYMENIKMTLFLWYCFVTDCESSRQNMDVFDNFYWYRVDSSVVEHVTCLVAYFIYNQWMIV